MKLAQILILTAASLCLSIVTQAQSTKKADQEFENHGYAEAARLYKVAEASAKGLDEKARIFYQLGESYRLIADHQQSLEWYEKAITAQYYNTNPEVYYNYGLSLQQLERWDDAVAQFNKYIAKGGEKTKANTHIKAAQDAAAKKAAKTKIIVENMAELNSPFFDYAPVFSNKKGDQMVFSSSRQAAQGTIEDPITGESFMDLFFTDQDKKGKWSTPMPLAGEVNTPSNEGAVAYNKDFTLMYYTFCKYENAKSWFACDITRISKQGDKYMDMTNLNLIDRNENDTSTVGHPCLSPDEKYLVFASDMPGGKGGKDLWYSTYDKKNDSWSKPVNLAGVNSRGDDMFPYIAENGTLYFASNGHPGLGGLDIFKSEKTGELTYGAVTALDYPINSSANDFALILENKGEGDKTFSGYFSSNRPGGKGEDDLYHFKEPPLEYSLIGTAYDKETGSPISGATVTLVGTSSSGDPINLKATTDGNGGFSFDKTQIKGQYTYTIDVQKDNYIGSGDKFTTVNIGSTNFAREYFLLPIVVGEKGVYEMPEVRYDYNKSELQVNNEVNSKDSLNYLYDIMMKYPNFVVKLEAHTDARGSDKDNQDLSQRRAQACVDYLVKEKGVDPGRLVAQGKGETEPRTLLTDYPPFKKGDVLTEAYIAKLPAEELKEKAHQLNRRTIFKILATDYKPKK